MDLAVYYEISFWRHNVLADTMGNYKDHFPLEFHASSCESTQPVHTAIWCKCLTKHHVIVHTSCCHSSHWEHKKCSFSLSQFVVSAWFQYRVEAKGYWKFHISFNESVNCENPMKWLLFNLHVKVNLGTCLSSICSADRTYVNPDDLRCWRILSILKHLLCQLWNDTAWDSQEEQGLHGFLCREERTDTLQLYHSIGTTNTQRSGSELTIATGPLRGFESFSP